MSKQNNLSQAAEEEVGPQQNLSITPNTTFDWLIYADATFAGLSILIPIPIIDWIFETIFRRRMIKTIAARRDQQLAPEVVRMLQRDSKTTKDCWAACLSFPLWATIQLAKSISRKILYFLTVKESSDMINYYWHQAFLMDYMITAQHLDITTAESAHQALFEVLDSITTSPLSQLAGKLTEGLHRVFRTLRRARRGKADKFIDHVQAEMAQYWPDFEDYFDALAAQYEKSYQQLIKQKQDSLIDEQNNNGLIL